MRKAFCSASYEIWKKKDFLNQRNSSKDIRPHFCILQIIWKLGKSPKKRSSILSSVLEVIAENIFQQGLLKDRMTEITKKQLMKFVHLFATQQDIMPKKDIFCSDIFIEALQNLWYMTRRTKYCTMNDLKKFERWIYSKIYNDKIWHFKHIIIIKISLRFLLRHLALS